MYPLFSCCNHLKRGSRNMMNKYGLRVSPCIVPLRMGMSCVLPKCSPMNVVVDCEYMFPTMTLQRKVRPYELSTHLSNTLESSRMLPKWYIHVVNTTSKENGLGNILEIEASCPLYVFDYYGEWIFS